MIHLQLLGKQEKAKPHISKWKEMIMTRAEIKEMETKRMIQRISEGLESWFTYRVLAEQVWDSEFSV
jgi:hypothetical protein